MLDLVVINSLHSHKYKLSNEFILSFHRTSLSIHPLQTNILHAILQSQLIMVSICISNLARQWPPSLNHHGLHVHLDTQSIMGFKYFSKVIGSQAEEMVELNGIELIINTLPHFPCHLNGIRQKELFWSEECMVTVRGYDGVPSHEQKHTNWLHL